MCALGGLHLSGNSGSFASRLAECFPQNISSTEISDIENYFRLRISAEADIGAKWLVGRLNNRDSIAPWIERDLLRGWILEIFLDEAWKSLSASSQCCRTLEGS